MSMEMTDSMDMVGGRRTNAITSHWRSLDSVAQALVVAVGVLFITCLGLVIAIAVANQNLDYNDDLIKKLREDLDKCNSNSNTTDPTQENYRGPLETLSFENTDWTI